MRLMQLLTMKLFLFLCILLYARPFQIFPEGPALRRQPYRRRLFDGVPGSEQVQGAILGGAAFLALGTKCLLNYWRRDTILDYLKVYPNVGDLVVVRNNVSESKTKSATWEDTPGDYFRNDDLADVLRTNDEGQNDLEDECADGKPLAPGIYMVKHFYFYRPGCQWTKCKPEWKNAKPKEWKATLYGPFKNVVEAERAKRMFHRSYDREWFQEGAPELWDSKRPFCERCKGTCDQTRAWSDMACETCCFNCCCVCLTGRCTEATCCEHLESLYGDTAELYRGCLARSMGCCGPVTYSQVPQAIPDHSVPDPKKWDKLEEKERVLGGGTYTPQTHFPYRLATDRFRSVATRQRCCDTFDCPSFCDDCCKDQCYACLVVDTAPKKKPYLCCGKPLKCCDKEWTEGGTLHFIPEEVKPNKWWTGGDKVFDVTKLLKLKWDWTNGQLLPEHRRLLQAHPDFNATVEEQGELANPVDQQPRTVDNYKTTSACHVCCGGTMTECWAKQRDNHEQLAADAADFWENEVGPALAGGAAAVGNALHAGAGAVAEGISDLRQAHDAKRAGNALQGREYVAAIRALAAPRAWGMVPRPGIWPVATRSLNLRDQPGFEQAKTQDDVYRLAKQVPNAIGFTCHRMFGIWRYAEAVFEWGDFNLNRKKISAMGRTGDGRDQARMAGEANRRVDGMMLYLFTENHTVRATQI